MIYHIGKEWNQRPESSRGTTKEQEEQAPINQIRQTIGRQGILKKGKIIKETTRQGDSKKSAGIDPKA